MPGYLGAGKRVDQPGAAFGGIFVELEFCVGAALGDQKAVAGARLEDDVVTLDVREEDCVGKRSRRSQAACASSRTRSG